MPSTHNKRRFCSCHCQIGKWKDLLYNEDATTGCGRRRIGFSAAESKRVSTGIFIPSIHEHELTISNLLSKILVYLFDVFLCIQGHYFNVKPEQKGKGSPILVLDQLFEIV